MKGNLYKTNRDNWHDMRCSYQIGRTCGAATALNAAAAMEWPQDMGERIQSKLEQIPNRDMLSRAWVKACLHQKSVVSLRWINDETADSDIAPPTPGTTTPAPKRHQRDTSRLSDMSTTPTAPKPMRLEFTLPMPNKRNDRPYKTPIKLTNAGKRATKTDDHTPVQIKEIKKKQQSQSIPEQPGIPHKSKKKKPKETPKPSTENRKSTVKQRDPQRNEQKTVAKKKRKGKLSKKNKHTTTHKYSNKTKT